MEMEGVETSETTNVAMPDSHNAAPPQPVAAPTHPVEDKPAAAQAPKVDDSTTAAGTVPRIKKKKKRPPKVSLPIACYLRHYHP